MTEKGGRDVEAPPSKDFGAVAGRILDQLNPTAWLPAALIVGDLWLMTAYLLTDPTELPVERVRAIADTLNGRPLGILVTTFLALVIVTILTQSVEFASIRFLEGYWGPGWIAGPATQIGTSLEAMRRRRITRRGEVLKRRALRSALPSIRFKFAADRTVPEIIDRVTLGRVMAPIDAAATPGYTAEERVKAMNYVRAREWLELADPHLVHQLEAVDFAASLFPEQDRLMPTRLGQTLRAAEDRLIGVDSDRGLRGYVIRNLHRINPLLLREHDQHRNRLDMYAVMSVSSVALAIANTVALWGDPSISNYTLAALAAGPIILAIFAYRGAIAAASDYCTALTEIDRQLAADGGRS